MVTFPPNPVPVVTEIGDGYILYIKENGMLENDEVAVVLSNTGIVRHFTTNQIKIWRNSTYAINI